MSYDLFERDVDLTMTIIGVIIVWGIGFAEIYLNHKKGKK